MRERLFERVKKSQNPIVIQLMQYLEDLDFNW